MKPKGTAGKLAKLGLRTGFDLVLHLPLRYEDETVLTPVDKAPPGKPVLVQAKVLSAKVVFRPRRQLVVHAEGMPGQADGDYEEHRRVLEGMMESLALE